MSFRDNLIHLRATHNMTQEQLAMLLGVSRQAVTKWEAEKSYPEMDKLLKLCQVFNCTLDDLVQGDLTSAEAAPVVKPAPSYPPADVFGYDAEMRSLAWRVALGIALIILATALSLPFFNADDPLANPLFTLPENVAAALGTLTIFIGVAALLALIIPAGLSYSHFVREHPFIEDFYTKEEKTRARSSFCYQLIGGIACIFMGICVVILFSNDPGNALDTISELPHGGETENIFGVSLMLALIAAGVFFIVHGSMMLARTNIAQYNLKAAEVLESHEIATANIPEAEKQELLRTQKADKRIGAICGVIMIIATIVALLMLFLPMAGSDVESYRTGPIALFWLPWPIGGLLCGIATILIKGFSNKE